jgi:hypothetical protein
MDRQISRARAATAIAAMKASGRVVTRRVGDFTGNRWYSQCTGHAMVQICVDRKTGAATLHVCNYKLVQAGVSLV